MGNLISDKGMRADPDMVAAITQMPTPQNNTAIKNTHAGRCTIQLVNNTRNGF
jgi:hypothetical protein